MFYERLNKLCKEAGTTPSAIALAAGMSKSNVTLWKRGQSPKLDSLIKLAEQLGVSVSALTEDDREAS